MYQENIILVFSVRQIKVGYLYENQPFAKMLKSSTGIELWSLYQALFMSISKQIKQKELCQSWNTICKELRQKDHFLTL